MFTLTRQTLLRAIVFHTTAHSSVLNKAKAGFLDTQKNHYSTTPKIPPDWRHLAPEKRQAIAEKEFGIPKNVIGTIPKGVDWTESPIGAIQTPFSILEVKVNDHFLPLPFIGMEEKSVYAGLKKWIAICNKHNGLSTTFYHRLNVPFQSQLSPQNNKKIDFNALKKHVEQNWEAILNEVKQNDPKLKNLEEKYHGELSKKVTILQLKNGGVVVEGELDPGPESHGAGLATRLAEKVCEIVANYLKTHQNIDTQWTGIVSNYYENPNIGIEIRFPISELHKDPETAIKIDRRIVELDEWSKEERDDGKPNKRFNTNKKGALNGLFPAAFGQDTRAIAVGLENTLKTKWTYDSTTQTITGTLEAALHLATRIPYDPILEPLIRNHDKETLSISLAAITLTQNFAALKVLATPKEEGGGITRNHGDLFNEDQRKTEG